jgi:hypothetical protein
MDAVYRFEFKDGVPAKEIEETLCWAVLNAESIYGKPKVRLDGSFNFDKEKRICVIDKTTEVGQCIAQIFTDCLSRAFGEEAFTVTRLRKKKNFADGEIKGKAESND